MKVAKALLKIIGYGLTIYIGIFVLWLMLAMACVEHDANQCGGDMLTQMVRTTHAPLIRLLVSSNK